MIAKAKNEVFRMSFFIFLVTVIALPSLALAIEPDDYEEDNTYHQARVIFPDASKQEHNFHAEGDEDWFIFHATPEPGKEIYTIEVVEPGSNCDAVIEIYDANGTTELTLDDEGNDEFEGDEEKFQWTCPTEGYYYIKITNFLTPSSPPADGTTDYAIRVVHDSALNTYGRVMGIVRDASSKVRIVEAKIRVSGFVDNWFSSDGTGISFYSGYIGFYTTPVLTGGTYTLTAELNGYETYSQEIVIDSAFQIIWLPIYMEPESDVPSKRYYKDADGDGKGHGGSGYSCINCTRPEGYVGNGDDCDDSDEHDENCAATAYYPDADGDGYGDKDADPSPTCSSGNCATNNTDCDDSDDKIHPDAEETCNSKDDNCNGQEDEGLSTQVYYLDEDEDGHGIPNSNSQHCMKPTGYAEDDDDCDDSDENIWLTYYKDADNDDYSDGTKSCTSSEDYKLESELSATSGDCNDADNSIYPGASEICGDNIDQDCQGGDLSCDDVDNDGDGYTENEGDCNDADSSIHPGVTEICGDNIDQDCQGGDLSCDDMDNDGDNYTENQGDCNDADSSIHPGATETCGDNIDQDCQGGDLSCDDMDNDGDGYTENEDDCNDADSSIHPGAFDTCGDGVDQDCQNGDCTTTTSISTTTTTSTTSTTSTTTTSCLPSKFHVDVDGDGYGNPNSWRQFCSQPPNYVRDNTDCNDSDPNINPGVTETCNGIDDNCNGQVDEGFPRYVYCNDLDRDGFGNPMDCIESCMTKPPKGYVKDDTDCDDSDWYKQPGQKWYRDRDGDKWSDGMRKTTCERPDGYFTRAELRDVVGDYDDKNASINPDAEELCNGVDDNCNDQTDECCEMYCEDADGDGHGNPNYAISDCIQPDGYVDESFCDDCDDSDPLLVKNTYYRDADGDGYGDRHDTDQACEPPEGYVTDNTDCNDADNSTYPGAAEIEDGKDNNCDGISDADLYEEDDHPAQASPITLNDDQEAQHHNFHDAADEDWVTFYGIADEVYSIEIGHSGSRCNAVMEFYETESVTHILAVDEESKDEKKQFLAWIHEDGIYHVGVRNHDPEIFGEETEYDLQVVRDIPCTTRTITGIISRTFDDEAIGGAWIQTDQKDTAVSFSDGSYRVIACSDSRSIKVQTDEGVAGVVIMPPDDSSEIEVDIHLNSSLHDAVEILQFLTGTPFNVLHDPNADGKIGLEDVIYILRQIAESEF